MNILYHHRTRGRDVEGVHIRSIAGALRESGHTVDVVSILDSGENGTKSETSALKKFISNIAIVFARKSPEFIFEMAEVIYNVLTLHKLNGQLKKSKPDLIYERYSQFLFITVWMAKRKKIKIILEINDSALLPRVRKLLFRRLSRRIEEWIFCNCDGLIFVSENFMSIAKKNYENMAPAVVSPNAVDCRIFSPDTLQRTKAREKLGVNNSIVCGYVGAFLKWHGIQEFVETIIPKMSENKNLILLLIGEGEVYKNIETSVNSARLNNQIILYGRVPHHKVANLLSAMDFAVLPDSNTFGSPMKIFEQMSMELGVIAPNYSPIEEVIENGKTGWLFRIGNMNECVDTVIKLSRDKNELINVGKNARNYVLNKRQWKNNADMIISFYRELVK